MSKSSKVVLDEDEYVEALERIIERDFFPELPTLRQQQHQLREARSVLRSSMASTICTAAQARTERGRHHRAEMSSVRSESSSWDQPTPMRPPSDTDVDIESSHGTQTTPTLTDADTDVVAGTEMTLNRFVATHTSEDNAAFTELQEKAVEEHKRRYHWAYEDSDCRGDPKLHLLADGTWISTAQRQIVDDVLAPKGLAIDNRPSAPETWPYRARNALLFPPDLKTSKEICHVPASSSSHLLENGVSSSALVTGATESGRVGRLPRAKRETVYANSRFTQRPAIRATAADSPRNERTTSEFELVQMTPVIAPGVDASPLMTWGDIEGTPLMLDPSATADRILNAPSFQVKEASKREKLADRLEVEARRQKLKHRQTSATPPLSGRKRTSSEEATPSRVNSIRSRLSSIRSATRTPFGSDSELRASYATPLLPPRHRKSSKM